MKWFKRRKKEKEPCPPTARKPIAIPGPNVPAHTVRKHLVDNYLVTAMELPKHVDIMRAPNFLALRRNEWCWGDGISMTLKDIHKDFWGYIIVYEWIINEDSTYVDINPKMCTNLDEEAVRVIKNGLFLYSELDFLTCKTRIVSGHGEHNSKRIIWHEGDHIACMVMRPINKEEEK